MEQIRTRTKVFENSFFPYCIKEWLKLGEEIRSIESSKQFKKTILDFIRPKENSIYALHDISDLKLLTRLRLNFSPLTSINSDTILRITITQCAVVVLSQNLQITISCPVNYTLA